MKKSVDTPGYPASNGSRLQRLANTLGVGRHVYQCRRRWLLSQCETYRDVVVVPYEHLLSRPIGGHDHKGGPIWPDWDKQTIARLNRSGEPRDVLPEFKEPLQHYNGEKHVWVGPIHPHFGHGIAEFSTRLACAVAAFEKPRLVFSSRTSEPITSVQEAPNWFKELLEWYGVSHDQVLLLCESASFEKLSVFPQAEQLPDIAPTEAYLDLLDEVVVRNLGKLNPPTIPGYHPGRPTYVSRATMVTCYGAEGYLEEILKKCDVNVFRPEEHELKCQMHLYCASPELIFSEGSAVHGLQLLGRSLDSVTILARRPEERFCEAFVRPRSKSLHYVNCRRGIIHGETFRGYPAPWNGLPLFDEKKLLDWLTSSGIEARGFWSSDRFHAKEREDVEKWLRFQGTQPHTESSKQSIIKGLEFLGYADLVDDAKGILYGSSSQKDTTLPMRDHP